MKKSVADEEFARRDDGEVNLTSELHPSDRKAGKGAKESREFHDNCSFIVSENRTDKKDK